MNDYKLQSIPTDLRGIDQTYLEQITGILIAKIQANKEQIIKAKFAENGFAHLLENIENKRFKKVVCERSGIYEKWYADNGTDEGVLIVTFVDPDLQPINNLDREFRMEMGIKYY